MLRRYKHDFDAINQILAAAVPEFLELLQRRYGCPVTRMVGSLPLARRAMIEVALRVLQSWRERVWANMLELLAEQPGAEAGVRARMDRCSGQIARAVVLRASLIRDRGKLRGDGPSQPREEIGRASCRERGEVWEDR